MVNEATIDKLREMQLDTMADAFHVQERDPAITPLSFADRLGLLVDAEWSMWHNRKLTRLIRGAQLHFPSACVEDIEYHDDRKLDKALISKLSTCTYQDRYNIVILGASGAGKTSWTVRSA